MSIKPKSKAIIMLIFFISLTALVSASYASDNVTETDATETITSDENTGIITEDQITIQMTTLKNVYVSADGDDANDGTVSNPKATIKNALENVDDGGEIRLAEGIYNEYNITVNKKVRITGDNPKTTVITCNNEKIFTINADTLLKSFTVRKTGIAGNTTIHNNAILNIDNVIFTGCEVKYSGGAIYNAGTLIVENSKFSRNSARFGAGIFNDGDLVLSNTTFTSNLAFKAGSAVYSTNKIQITKSTFTNNTNTAIYLCPNTNNNTITQSTFTNNTAPNGASIYNRNSKLTITQTKFNNNKATKQASAIYSTKELEIKNCSFKDNINTTIYIGKNHKTCTIESSNFTSNTATKGGAICNLKNIKISNSTFKNNSARFGGCIYNAKNLIINNTIFISNNADKAGSAVYSTNKIQITKSTFTNNTNTVIYLCPNTNNNTITQSTFTNNTAPNGASIYNRNSKLTITQTKLKNNKAYKLGSAVYSIGTLIVERCNFTDNTNSAVYVSKTLSGKNSIISSYFISNNAETGAGIYSGNTSLNVEKCHFYNNSAKKGSVIFNQLSDATLNYNVLIDNFGNDVFNDRGILNIDYNWWGSYDLSAGRVSNAKVNNWLYLSISHRPDSSLSNITTTISLYNICDFINHVLNRL